MWLDPGMAFGTGNHETTRLVVERLVRFAEGNNGQGRVIDAGCGSGILVKVIWPSKLITAYLL